MKILLHKKVLFDRKLAPIFNHFQVKILEKLPGVAPDILQNLENKSENLITVKLIIVNYRNHQNSVITK